MAAAAALDKAITDPITKFQKSYFDVLGLCCSSEVPLIENILKSLAGVKEVSVIVPSRTVIVVHDSLLISQLEIVKALNQARLEANVRAYGGTSYQKKWPSPYAMACGILLAISLLKYVYHPLRWLALGAVAVGIFPIIFKGFAALRNFRLDINILMLIAVMGTIAMNDYTEAGVIVFLFTIAEWLESRASHKATAVMSSLMNMAPQKAVIAETGEEVDAGEVKLNTVLAVKAGEVIPIDGIVVDGKCEVDEKTLTGESYPVSKQKDSAVWAGTINLNGYISVKTTAVAEDCVVAKMAKLVEEAQNSKSKTQRFIDKCSQYYTPAVIVISAGFAVIPLALGVSNHRHWFHLALVVLVCACPCALILSTPVVTYCALTKAATSGLLIKGGDYLETLAKVKIMAFDKTGTITRGEFVVSDFRTLTEDLSLNTLLYWVSSIESKSSHPMAAALIEHGRSLSIEPNPEDVEDYQNFPGEGIYGKIGGEDIYIGNGKIAERAGCAIVPSAEEVTRKGNTIGYIFSGASPVGIFSLSDACRTGASEAINRLKSLGIKTAMLTGDNQAAAMHAQEQLGNALNVVHSELLPEDKAKIITEFKQEGKTAMIGDGVNDAPALATADIGISMGISGSALATETGQVILMSNDIRKVPEAIQLARKSHRKVIENIIVSMATKAGILALAFGGHPLVWAAVLADVGTCLIVILNSMLLLHGTQYQRGKCSNSSSSSSSHTDKQVKKCCNSSAKSCKSSEARQTKKDGQKCCQSSVDLHTRNHGRESGHCHPSESQQHCCSDSKAQNRCEPEDCSSHGCASRCDDSSPYSSNPRGNKKCCTGSDHGTEEDKHFVHRSNNKDDHDIEAQNIQGNCREDHLNHSVSESIEKGLEQKCCQSSVELHIHNHGCESSHCNPSDSQQHCCSDSKAQNRGEPEDCSSHGCASRCDESSSCSPNPCGINKCCAGSDQGTEEDKHCVHGSCVKDDHDIEAQNIQKCLVQHNSSPISFEKQGNCREDHLNHSVCVSVEKVLEPTNHEDCHSHKCSDKHVHVKDSGSSNRCCKDHTEGLCAAADEPLGTDQVESSVAKSACMNLEKKEIGGCCKSYMNQCCGNRVRFGAAGFGGGLSEIVTE